MDAAVASRLLEVNRRFYADFGRDFSATRRRIQPGVKRLLGTIPPEASLLDLGCGNGGLARALARRGFSGAYLGLDFSRPLLAEAGALPEHFSFAQADLTDPDWEKMINESVVARGALRPEAISSLARGLLRRQSTAARNDTCFDVVLCFAVLHHIPSHELRLNILAKIYALLAPGGRFVHSEWQFLNSPKLAARIQSWEKIGLSAADVDAGDYLLDWRAGGRGLRYVHHFDEAELANLAAASGWRAAETFYSDGEGGRLGLYQVWKKL
jgi:SAM-dependent methyltransferase